METIEVIGHPLLPETQRVIISCLELQLPYNLTTIESGKYPDWFFRLSPLAIQPIIQWNDEVIFESQSICEFLNDLAADKWIHGLRHTLPFERVQKAKLRAYCEVIESIYSDISNLERECGDRQRPLVDSIRSKITEVCRNKASHTPYFFDSSSPSLIDISFAVAMERLFVLDKLHPEWRCLEGLTPAKIWAKDLSSSPWHDLVLGKEFQESYRQSLISFSH